MIHIGVRILGAIIFLGLGSQAFAQLPKSVAAAPAAKPERPADAEPNSTLASFGDWTLRCQRLGNGAESQHICEVAQQIRAQGQQNPMAELAIRGMELRCMRSLTDAVVQRWMWALDRFEAQGESTLLDLRQQLLDHSGLATDEQPVTRRLASVPLPTAG